MIYLDSAATTLQKPPSVAYAVTRAMRHMTSPGRGGYPPAMAAAATAFACRDEAAALFDVSDPEQVVFTSNATHALNIAIHSLVKPGDTVLISGYEHNAVTRPLHVIKNIKIKTAHARLFDRQGILNAFAEEMTPEVSVVITTHVSNVFGFILPIEEIADLCRQRNIPLIIDASQSAGCLPVSLKKLGAAFIAMPGHKGLYGPQGTGLLLCNAPTIPLLAGGTGSESMRQDMPAFLPDRLEAGTHNIPGIAGLLEGIRFVRRNGLSRIQAHETAHIRTLAEGLGSMGEIEVFSSSAPDAQAGVLSFRWNRWDCEELAETLGRRGIAVRSGLHCAPLAHQSAGTLESGTVRASVSSFTSRGDIRRFLQEIRRLKAL